ncbi:ABC transporter substrate-binding protein [Actinophytocola algeriensis]|uniref:ABC-type glycerol-3-phosphate transport system substrate-binding protein n=1 Tax=Actinophytocola algeriensis TaxID=1768010 RepID=A0A7W7Q1V7_9PSEU|nr:sugar ABC transporter substrate-binding protein [Actinophytocola algeriensis]MBB4905440.1 ABC-type glycerol-3-phosphate transport system substrate-binding protein [Actinophytocola algeriensis]MBE1472875.1 ABC-type glycerol-3-phosphate transport system substrate-binding protein [Actinophytocola algeriensis]
MKPKALLGIGAAAALLLSGCALGGGESTDDSGGSTEGPVTLTFQSLAYQDSTVAATKEIVDAWNKDNPDIQIKLTQGTWDNVHDQLVTQFQGGTAPDIIHDESSDIMGFAEQGYLADIGQYLSQDVKDAVSKDVWDTVTTADGKVVAAPTLLQTYVAFANVDAFKAAGIEVPTGDQLSWDDLQAAAKKLATGGKFGVGWGLKQPTAAIMNTALGFDGTFFDTKDDGSATIDVGDGEVAVPEKIHAMAYQDKSLDPVTLTQSGTDVLPGFLSGKYGMYIGGNFLAQQITEAAQPGFNWTVLPPLAGSAGPVQAANPQTMSVSAQSKAPEQAAKFIDYFMNAENQAKLAQGDWLIPASAPARDAVAEQTKDTPVWEPILKTGDDLAGAPFQKAKNYPQWKDQYATPALQQYFANSISVDDLKKQLTDGWQSLG